jgi:uncharacterized protein YdhG (YjbR/CyaY superfamily)
MKNRRTDFRSIDEYIATFPAEVQSKLQALRAAIKAAVPEAEEKIAYQLPTFDLNGRHLVYFSAWKKHIAIYPIPSCTETFKKKISQYVDGKSTLKFPLDKPLPLELIGEIVKLRVADNLKNNGTKPSR